MVVIRGGKAMMCAIPFISCYYFRDDKIQDHTQNLLTVV